MSPGVESAIRSGVVAVLVAAACAVLALAYSFGQQRFFTIDEYQYGHATWLVSQGELPYVDFYEHHFPLSYLLHAPLLDDDAPFAERALGLRTIAFSYLAAMALALFTATRSNVGAGRGLLTALLSVSLPIAFGFGLMSSLEYRADNFATCLFVICLAGLEWNRRRGSALVAGVCGGLFAASVFMTQKLLFVGGGALAAMLAWDVVARMRRGPGVVPCIARPVVLVAASAGFAVLALAVGAAFGLLGAGFDATILHAFEHEALYPRVRVWKYALPFLSETRWTTLPIAAFALYFAAVGRDAFWPLALAVALASAAMMQTQYPYNFVYPGFLLVVCALRGFADAAERLLPASGPRGAWQPLLFLLPLALIPNQLAFLENTSNNAHQLALLCKLEALSSPEDAVIDGAGGALFRRHGSHYWYHGSAHRVMFRDYFEKQLVRDYRESGARFWIQDMRQSKLPVEAQRYFREHFVRLDGSLFGVGFRTPKTGDESASRSFEVLRAEEFFVYEVVEADARSTTGSDKADSSMGADAEEDASVLAGDAFEDDAESPVRLIRENESTGLTVDGRPVAGGSLYLATGRHEVEVAAGSPAYLVTPFPINAFASTIPPGRPHSPLFEYEARFRQPRSDVVDLELGSSR